MYYLIHFNCSKKKKLPESQKPEDNLKLLLLMVLLSFIASSCITRKACDRRYSPISYDSVSVVTHTVTTYRDTTIYIHLPGDTVYKSIGLNEGVSELQTSFAKSYAWVKDGKLEHKLEQKDSIMQNKIDDGIKITEKSTQKDKLIEIKSETKQSHIWGMFFILYFFIEMIKGILFIRINKNLH